MYRQTVAFIFVRSRLKKHGLGILSYLLEYARALLHRFSSYCFPLVEHVQFSHFGQRASAFLAAEVLYLVEQRAQ